MKRSVKIAIFSLVILVVLLGLKWIRLSHSAARFESESLGKIFVVSGLPYTKLQIGAYTDKALIDLSSSFTIFSDSVIESTDKLKRQGSILYFTPNGSVTADQYEIQGVQIANITMKVVAPIGKTQFSIIGADILFANGPFKLSSDELAFRVPKPIDQRTFCAPAKFAVIKEKSGSTVTVGLLVKLPVDGVKRDVLLDTGSNFPLATYNSEGSADKSTTLTRTTASGTSKVQAQVHDAIISIGGEKVSLKRYDFEKSQIDVPGDVKLGAVILKFFDLYVDPGKEVCFQQKR